MADKKLSEETFHPTLTGSEKVRISALLVGILTSGYATIQEIIDLVPNATTILKGKIKLAGQLGGTADLPTVTGFTETSGPTALALGAVADGQYLKRSGSTVVGSAVSGGGADILQVQIFS
jgi:hypothetical protein